MSSPHLRVGGRRSICHQVQAVGLYRSDQPPGPRGVRPSFQVDTGGELDVKASSIKIRQSAIDSCILYRLVTYREPVVKRLFVMEDRGLLKNI